VLPIRTYPEFEHKMGEPEVQWKDPMATLMDLMSSLQKGEQLWYQILLIPIDTSWVKKKEIFISKILKEKLPGTKANGFVDQILEWMSDISEQIYSLWGDIEDKKKSDDPLKMMNLKPGLKKQVEAAELKCAKLGFEVSIRALYLSRKEVMNKAKVVNGFVGYIKQFNTNDLNSLKPDMKVTATSTNYFRAEQRLIARKNKIMLAYKTRSDVMGRKPWVLNVEELATLWHFPIDAVIKAPLVQRAGGRRIEPPMTLPFDSGVKQSSVVREPLFDDNYEIVDEEATRTEEQETPRTKANPKFMDETVIVQDEESPFAEDIPENLPVVAEPEPEEKPEEQLVSHNAEPSRGQPASPNRGEPPTNLPFAD
jgi:hypothetical protein